MHYPEFHLIRSEENLGFSAGNNAAIRRSKGDWVLLLNPDTVVPEDTFEVLARAESDPQIGAIGVPMFDLVRWTLASESKRGMPLLGFLLSHERIVAAGAERPTWNGYYYGHVGRDETAPVEVLSGAFMWMRRAALDQSVCSTRTSSCMVKTST